MSSELCRFINVVRTYADRGSEVVLTHRPALINRIWPIPGKANRASRIRPRGGHLRWSSAMCFSMLPNVGLALSNCGQVSAEFGKFRAGAGLRFRRADGGHSLPRQPCLCRASWRAPPTGLGARRLCRYGSQDSGPSACARPRRETQPSWVRKAVASHGDEGGACNIGVGAMGTTCEGSRSITGTVDRPASQGDGTQ